MPWSKENLPPSVKNKDWSDHQKEVFCKTANAILEKTGDEGEAIATGTKQAEEKQNAKQFPAKFYAKHMQAGIAKYDGEKPETIYIDLENMKRMMPSGVGKPVYVLHQEVRLETLKEDSHGLISGSFYNELDGWLWFEFMATDDIAFQAIANGWSVSNAYIPTESGPAGTWHNCPYDREILAAQFTHLAIVPDPRYEGACVFTPDEFKMYQAARREQLEELQNSKSPEGKTLMKFFKNKKEEVATVDAETMVELQNGKTVSVQEMVNAMEEKKNAEDDADKKKKEDDEKKNSDQKVMVNGVEMALDDLINSYCAMKNAADEEEKKNAEDEEKEKKNAEEAEKKNALEGKKHFEELKNAHVNHKGAEVRIIETSMDKMKRGQDRYGSVN